MSFLDRLFGRAPAPQSPTAMSSTGPMSPTAPRPKHAAAGLSPAAVAPDPDEAAIARYQYLLRTAPPEDLERAHAEAFARLTPAQRAEVLRSLSEVVPASERATSDDPQALARMATRAEIRDPGTMERTFAGPGMGSMMMSTLAGAFIGTAIAQTMFGGMYPGVETAGAGADAGTEAAVAPRGWDRRGLRRQRRRWRLGRWWRDRCGRLRRGDFGDFGGF